MTARLAGWWRRVDSAAGGYALDLGLYALSAAFAAITAATSTLAPHRAWGAVAVWGYAAAAVATLILGRRSAGSAGTVRIRAAVAGLAWVAVTVVPLVTQAIQRAGGLPDRAQEEVAVIEMAGQRLLDSGTPYLGRSAIAALPEAERLLGYLPYQPGMALFGLPRALFGDVWWTDARVWFVAATAAVLGGAVAATRTAPAPLLLRAVQAATVLPVCALTLATGGDDLPVLALVLLALALTAGNAYGAAGAAAGAAGALKLFAWPVAVVLAVLAVRQGRAARFVAPALGLPALALAPAVLADPGAVVENLVSFPLGRGLVTSPAQSPFPGHLVATGLPGGRTIATALIVTAVVVIAVGLLRRPPRTATAAALWAGYGLLAAILLMPSTRFGYLLYPVALLVWAPALCPAPQRVADLDRPAAYP